MVLTASCAFAANDSPPADTVITSQGAPGALPATVSSGRRWVDIYGFCRTIDGAAAQAPLPLGSAAEWLTFRQNAPASLAQNVCCRPENVTLCAGAAGGPVAATITSSGANGYGALAATGTATAQCTDQWGLKYEDTRTYQCSQTGSGATANGAWSQIGGDSWTCSPNAHVTYGGCSTAGVGGWGNTWEQAYDSCGNLTNQGYFGPSCYTQPPCTPNGSCSGACGGGWGVDNCGNSCQNNSACGPRYIGSCSCNPTGPFGPAACPNGYPTPCTATCSPGVDSPWTCDLAPGWTPTYDSATGEGCPVGTFGQNSRGSPLCCDDDSGLPNYVECWAP